MFKTFRWIPTTVLIFCLLLMVSCGKKTISKSETASAFDNATPEFKDAWDKATEADKVNDYVKATLAYTYFLNVNTRTNLSEKQLAAVTQAYVDLNQRMSSAAEKGDPSAIQASRSLIEIERQRH